MFDIANQANPSLDGARHGEPLGRVCQDWIGLVGRAERTGRTVRIDRPGRAGIPRDRVRARGTSGPTRSDDPRRAMRRYCERGHLGEVNALGNMITFARMRGHAGWVYQRTQWGAPAAGPTTLEVMLG